MTKKKRDLGEAIFELLTKYGEYEIANGIVYVTCSNGDVWDFTEPLKKRSGKFDGWGTQYNPRDEETYTDWTNGRAVNVTLVKEYLHQCEKDDDPVPIEMMDYADICLCADAGPWKHDPADLERVDMAIPLILVHLETGETILVDGYHRLHIAKNKGLKELPTVTVEDKEVAEAVLLRRVDY